jgi:hypothetical protein
MTSTPPTEQQLAEIETRHTAATPGPWTAVELPANANHKHPAHWVKAEYVDGNCTSSEVVADCPWRQADAEFTAHARTDVPLLLDAYRRQRAELAAFEMLAPQQCPAGKHADWLVDSEYAHACPWCQVEGLRAELAAARGQAIAWAAEAVDEKLTAEPDHNRASALYELLLHLRGELPCTCARSGGLHSKGCRRCVPGHEQISRQNQLAVYRAAAVAPDAASEATSAPLSASQPSSVSESAQSPTGAATGRLGDLPSTEDLASADNPTHLRWGLGDVQWGDDDSVIVMLSGPDREAYWLELDPTQAAVLREDLAGPDGEPRRTLTPDEYDAAWHAVDHATVHADPGTVLHAVLDRLGIEWQDAARPA